MPFLSGVANSFQRKEVSKFLRLLDREPVEKLSERLIMLYWTRSVCLFPTPSQRAQLHSMGIPDAAIEAGAIFVYHYQKGNEVPLIELMQEAQRTKNRELWTSLNMHFYTNLATSYDGYDQLIRDMWNKLFAGAATVKSVYQRIFPDDALPEGRDIPKCVFLDNPRTITPHFFLTNSPISRELDERRALGVRLGIL